MVEEEGEREEREKKSLSVVRRCFFFLLHPYVFVLLFVDYGGGGHGVF